MFFFSLYTTRELISLVHIAGYENLQWQNYQQHFLHFNSDYISTLSNWLYRAFVVSENYVKGDVEIDNFSAETKLTWESKEWKKPMATDVDKLHTNYPIIYVPTMVNNVYHLQCAFSEYSPPIPPTMCHHLVRCPTKLLVTNSSTICLPNLSMSHL